MNRVDVHMVIGRREQWLQECLDSLKNEPINLFTVHRVEGDTGAARTQAFTMGTAEYVSFVDPDDKVVPGIFTKCTDILDDNPDVVGVYTDQVLINRHGDYLMDGWSINEQPFLRFGYRPELSQGHHNLYVLRREEVEKCLPLKTKRMPEVVLIHELKRLGSIHHLKEIGYFWRIHGKNTCLTYTKDELNDAMRCVEGINAGY